MQEQAVKLLGRSNGQQNHISFLYIFYVMYVIQLTYSYNVYIIYMI